MGSVEDLGYQYEDNCYTGPRAVTNEEFLMELFNIIDKKLKETEEEEEADLC